MRVAYYASLRKKTTLLLLTVPATLQISILELGQSISLICLSLLL